ncbi:MAG: hypothetical protein K8823_1309 [Cenarchaeum symbiont of Oopsacas minuta]|nr:hypothetical protein [Cenarchaeum symbiont of Oopsacas minuta]
MEEGEKKIRQEDCNEDNLGQGILTLTNKRIAFDKTSGRIMDFAKKFGDTVIDVPLEQIQKVWSEGLFIKKVCIMTKTADGEKTFKFGVLGTGSWSKAIQNAKDDQ